MRSSAPNAATFVQAAMNARLAQSLQSVPLAALHSYLLGSLTLIGLLFSGLLPTPDWRAIGTARARGSVR